jgi:hypothetical protein
MHQLLRLAAITLVLFLAKTPAHAGLLALDFQGVAAPPSSLGSTSFVGDSFTVQADFDPTKGNNLKQGVASYAVTSLAVTVGGTPYSVTDPSDYSIVPPWVDWTLHSVYSPGHRIATPRWGDRYPRHHPRWTSAMPASCGESKPLPSPSSVDRQRRARSAHRANGSSGNTGS